MASVWYGVDPLTEEYTEISGYVYCHANPVRLIDPDGNGDKDDGSAISVTLSLGWQIGFKIGRFGMDIDLGSTNYSMSENGTENYLSSGFGFGIGYCSFESRNTRKEMTSSLDNMSGCFPEWAKTVSTTQEFSETKIAVGLEQFLENSLSSTETNTTQNNIILGKTKQVSHTPLMFNVDHIFKKEPELKTHKNSSKTSRKSKAYLKCIVGVSFEADFKTLYKKGASAVTDFGRQAVKESKKAINNGVQVVKNLWDSFTSLF